MKSTSTKTKGTVKGYFRTKDTSSSSKNSSTTTKKPSKSTNTSSRKETWPKILA